MLDSCAYLRIWEALEMRGGKIRLILVRDVGGRGVAINKPEDVRTLLGPEAQGLDRECFWRIDLSANNEVLGFEVVSVGTLTSSLVHPREVFKGALLNNAAGIIVAHNHPAGDPSPSAEDRKTTRRLVEAGKLIGIPVLDHIILSDNKFYSFQDRRLMPA